MTLGKTIFTFSATVILMSCGIKGPPLPPIEEETIQNQMAAETHAGSADTTRPPDMKKKKK